MGGTNVLSTGVFASAAMEPDRACLPDILCLCCWGRTGVFRRQSQSGARAGLPCGRVNTRKGVPGNYALPEAPDEKRRMFFQSFKCWKTCALDHHNRMDDSHVRSARTPKPGGSSCRLERKSSRIALTFAKKAGASDMTLAPTFLQKSERTHFSASPFQIAAAYPECFKSKQA